MFSIINYINEFINMKCRICNKKIYLLDDTIIYGGLRYCSLECFNHI